MTNMTIKKNDFDELQKLLVRAEVPQNRRGNLRWVDANLDRLNLSDSNRRRARTYLNRLMFRTTRKT